MGTHKKIVECAGIALVNKGRIFLIRPLFNGLVQQPGIPKGHVEKGESPQQTAVREFEEETGIHVDPHKLEFLCYVFTRIDDDTDKKVIVYSADGDGSEYFHGSNFAKNGEPENIDGGYVSLEYAKDVITTYQIPIVERLMKRRNLSSFKRFLKTFSWFD